MKKRGLLAIITAVLLMACMCVPVFAGTGDGEGDAEPKKYAICYQNNVNSADVHFGVFAVDWSGETPQQLPIADGDEITDANMPLGVQVINESSDSVVLIQRTMEGAVRRRIVIHPGEANGIFFDGEDNVLDGDVEFILDPVPTYTVTYEDKVGDENVALTVAVIEPDADGFPSQRVLASGDSFTAEHFYDVDPMFAFGASVINDADYEVKLTMSDGSGSELDSVTIPAGEANGFLFFEPGEIPAEALHFVLERTEEPAAAEYAFTEGADGKVTVGSDKDYTFKIEDKSGAGGEFDKLVSAEVDGKALTAEECTAEAGSVVLTLKGSYVKTLAVGKHTVKVSFTDGSAETTLTVESVPNKPDNKPKSPQTGDMTPAMAGIFGALAAVCVGMAVVVRRRTVR